MIRLLKTSIKAKNVNVKSVTHLGLQITVCLLTNLQNKQR